MWWLVGDVFVDGTSCVRAIVVVPVVLCVMCVIYMFDQVELCLFCHHSTADTQRTTAPLNLFLEMAK